ncbi:MAG: prolipoprotein diacylglyceryl transferase [Tenericutes bacterium]|nr:prolipoprotein diacylglyceryl transferase [Mycoplasmatota bacterium]
MNPVALKLGNLTVTWYAIFILSGIIVAYILINKESKKYNISSSFVSNLIFWCVIFGIIGARIYYVLFNLDYYMQDPIEIIKIWNGGLAIHGGIIAGIITLVVYCKKYKINILKMTDIACVGVIIAQAIGRWGNFFNGEAHGGIVSRTFLENLHLPNFIIEGMHIGKYYYAPTYLYESVLNVIGFILLIIIRKFKKIKLGNITALYLIWYGIVRFIIESMRTDSLLLGNMKIAQLISIIMIIIGIIMLIVTSIKCDRYKNVEGGSNE